MDTLVRSHTRDDLERLVSQPLDLDYEAARAKRRRFRCNKKGLIVPHRFDDFGDERGSAVTGTFAECIYASSAAGTAKASFTTEFQINDTAGMGAVATLPPYLFRPGGGGTTALRITARGVHSDTSTAPTWQHFVRFNAGTPAVPPTGPNVGSTPSTASMLAISQTNNLWEYEIDVTLVTLGAAGANTTLRGLGIFTSITTANSSVAFPIFGGGATPGTVATFDISATTYITYSVACGTSNAANSVQLLQLMVQGLN